MPEIILNGPEGRIECRYNQGSETGCPVALILHPEPFRLARGIERRRALWHPLRPSRAVVRYLGSPGKKRGPFVPPVPFFFQI